MVQVTLLVIVIGVEVVTLGGWIIPTMVRLGGRVPWLWALFGIVSFLSPSIASNTWAIRKVLVPCMKMFDWAWNIGRGFACSTSLKISLAPVVASMSRLVPFALANILQAAVLILQCNVLVN